MVFAVRRRPPPPEFCFMFFIEMISDHYSPGYQKYIFKSVFPNKVGFSGPLEQLNGSTGAAEVGGTLAKAGFA